MRESNKNKIVGKSSEVGWESIILGIEKKDSSWSLNSKYGIQILAKNIKWYQYQTHYEFQNKY